MELIDTLFDRMDSWRHLPSYQLERRADLFFSLYLPEVLGAKLGFPVREQVVPEFPARKGTIYPDSSDNAPIRIDYLALSADGNSAIFVELKTDRASRRAKQDDYLDAAVRVGLHSLLTGLLDVFRATSHKRKYFCLLEYLEGMGLLRIPAGVREIMTRPRLQGVVEAAHGVEITSHVSDCLVSYVEPVRTDKNSISFEEFAAVVRQHDDPLSQRFAQSLIEWSEVTAGRKPQRQSE
jgi:hypothetical protein